MTGFHSLDYSSGPHGSHINSSHLRKKSFNQIASFPKPKVNAERTGVSWWGVVCLWSLKGQVQWDQVERGFGQSENTRGGTHWGAAEECFHEGIPSQHFLDNLYTFQISNSETNWEIGKRESITILLWELKLNREQRDTTGLKGSVEGIHWKNRKH